MSNTKYIPVSRSWVRTVIRAFCRYFTKSPVGMTAAEYEDLMALCNGWFQVESRLIGPPSGSNVTERVEALQRTAIFNIGTFNLGSLDTVDRVFRTTANTRTTTRLQQLYMQVCQRYGMDRVNSWSIELQELLIGHGIPRKVVSDTFVVHPYLVLVPTLNAIAMLSLSKVI